MAASTAVAVSAWPLDETQYEAVWDCWASWAAWLISPLRRASKSVWAVDRSAVVMVRPLEAASWAARVLLTSFWRMASAKPMS